MWCIEFYFEKQFHNFVDGFNISNVHFTKTSCCNIICIKADNEWTFVIRYYSNVLRGQYCFEIRTDIKKICKLFNTMLFHVTLISSYTYIEIWWNKKYPIIFPFIISYVKATQCYVRLSKKSNRTLKKYQVLDNIIN